MFSDDVMSYIFIANSFILDDCIRLLPLIHPYHSKKHLLYENLRSPIFSMNYHRWSCILHHINCPTNDNVVNIDN